MTFNTLTMNLGNIMSDHAGLSWIPQQNTPVSNGADARERRQWVRFVFPNLVTRLSWFNGTETVYVMVNLVNVSAGGAAVMLDVRPPRDRPCMLHFDNNGVSTGPVPANLISMETTDEGRILASFAFESVQTSRELIQRQKERRAWQRVVPRERRARLAWEAGDLTFSVPGEVQNISGGGAAVQTDVSPPWNQPIWLAPGSSRPGSRPRRMQIGRDST